MKNKYDYLKRYIPGGSEVNDNWFLPVSISEIEYSEKIMGRGFPLELRTFYEEVGFGMLRSPHSPPEDYDFYNKNAFLPPNVVAHYNHLIVERENEQNKNDFSLSILLSLDQYYINFDGYTINKAVIDLFEKGDLPFFEIGNSNQYLFLKTESENPNAVWALGGVKIEDSFEKFVWRLYFENPSFYDSIIEAAYQ